MRGELSKQLRVEGHEGVKEKFESPDGSGYLLERSARGLLLRKARGGPWTKLRDKERLDDERKQLSIKNRECGCEMKVHPGERKGPATGTEMPLRKKDSLAPICLIRTGNASRAREERQKKSPAGLRSEGTPDS